MSIDDVAALAVAEDEVEEQSVDLDSDSEGTDDDDADRQTSTVVKPMFRSAAAAQSSAPKISAAKGKTSAKESASSLQPKAGKCQSPSKNGGDPSPSPEKSAASTKRWASARLFQAASSVGTEEEAAADGGDELGEDDDDEGGVIVAVDGRAEHLKRGLQEALSPIQDRADKDLLHFDAVDNEEFLGSGPKFKKELKDDVANARNLERDVKVIQKRISVSKNSSVYKDETAICNALIARAAAVLQLMKAVLESQSTVDQFIEGMEAAVQCGCKPSAAFALHGLWKNFEHLLSHEKFEDAVKMLYKDGADFKVFNNHPGGYPTF